jgi:hypothetical protein
LHGLINKGGFSGDFGETLCATRIGNVALEKHISRSEVGCGEGLVSKRGVLVAYQR